MSSEITGDDNFSSASGGCTAWVTFDGNLTPTINGSYNISVVDRPVAANYDVLFLVNMDNINYSVVCTGSDGANNVNISKVVKRLDGFTFVTTVASSGSGVDADQVDIVVFGGKI